MELKILLMKQISATENKAWINLAAFNYHMKIASFYFSPTLERPVDGVFKIHMYSSHSEVVFPTNFLDLISSFVKSVNQEIIH